MENIEKDIDYMKFLVDSLRDIDRNIGNDSKNHLDNIINMINCIEQENKELREELTHLKDFHTITIDIKNDSESDMVKSIDKIISLLKSIREGAIDNIMEDFVDGIE